jgi:four helix bundle protein
MPTDFAPGSAPAAATPLFSGGALLDAEKLDCYRLAVEFQVLAARLLPLRGLATLRDQLDRASVSIVLNVAEGAGRLSGPDKARFYAMARGSATECAAIVGLVLARGLAPASSCRHPRSLLVRVVQMLTKLIARLAAQAGPIGKVGRVFLRDDGAGNRCAIGGVQADQAPLHEEAI